MKYSKLAVEILRDEEKSIYYDPVYHGRTLKVFGIDDDPLEVLKYLTNKYRELGYGAIIFDTHGKFPEEGFETVIKIEDGKPTGLDPIKIAKKGMMDLYSAVTVVQTVYELDRILTDRLYTDILQGKISSVPEAVKANEKYSEVILEGYTALDEAFYKGKPPKLGKSILVNLGDAHSVSVVGMAFLILSAIVEKRRGVMIGVDDVAVLAYTTAGSAAMPLLTRPARKRVTVLGTRYAIDSVLNIAGPTLLLYTDPDIQGVIYESNGVPPGAMRKYVHKGRGVLITRSTETINVEEGELPF
ncbi:hypothetical protein [Thermococcus sp.]